MSSESVLKLKLVSLCVGADLFLLTLTHKVLENKYLRLHENCMSEHNFDYTNTNCEICDSIIKKK